MEYMDLSCSDFIRKLSSREPVPVAAALRLLLVLWALPLVIWWVPLHLGRRKKYAAGVEDEIQQCMEDVIIMQKELMDLVPERYRYIRTAVEALRDVCRD